MLRSWVQLLKFTPLEFETIMSELIRLLKQRLKFTPLEFETKQRRKKNGKEGKLKFTPLEFETLHIIALNRADIVVKIYSVGV